MTASDTPFDLIGVGFGPSNLALAVALEETGSPLSARFLEARPGFAWHPGMMIPGADMQVSFLKDLVSQRNPQSAFSFVSCLHAKGRLGRFINRKTFFPSRVEFNDYLAWVAAQMPVCDYDRRVVGLEPVTLGGQVRMIEVIAESRSGEQSCYHARNLVIAPGGQPRWPDALEALRGHPRVIHSNDYIAAALPRLEPGLRIAVIGGGQSEVEIFADLANRQEAPKVDLILRGRAIRPSDDTPFVNEIFDPAQTDRFHARPTEDRAKTLRALAATNYAVADGDLIQAIYDMLYEQSVAGGDRLALHAEAGLRAVGETPQRLCIEINCPDGPRSLTVDMILLATGYDRTLDARVLRGLARLATGAPPDRDYRLPMQPDFAPVIFVQGYSEPTHGLRDTLLSVLALRAEELRRSLATLARPDAASVAAE